MSLYIGLDSYRVALGIRLSQKGKVSTFHKVLRGAKNVRKCKNMGDLNVRSNIPHVHWSRFLPGGSGDPAQPER